MCKLFIKIKNRFDVDIMTPNIFIKGLLAVALACVIVVFEAKIVQLTVNWLFGDVINFWGGLVIFVLLDVIIYSLKATLNKTQKGSEKNDY